jgi:hypothetical protein
MFSAQHDTWRLRPAIVEGTKQIAPVTAIRDLDTPRLLTDRHHLQLSSASPAL